MGTAVTRWLDKDSKRSFVVAKRCVVHHQITLILMGVDFAAALQHSAVYIRIGEMFQTACLTFTFPGLSLKLSLLICHARFKLSSLLFAAIVLGLCQQAFYAVLAKCVKWCTSSVQEHTLSNFARKSRLHRKALLPQANPNDCLLR
eukprot:5893046-Amphidinium_carterae.2